MTFASRRINKITVAVRTAKTHKLQRVSALAQTVRYQSSTSTKNWFSNADMLAVPPLNMRAVLP